MTSSLVILIPRISSETACHPSMWRAQRPVPCLAVSAQLRGADMVLHVFSFADRAGQHPTPVVLATS